MSEQLYLQHDGFKLASAEALVIAHDGTRLVRHIYAEKHYPGAYNEGYYVRYFLVYRVYGPDFQMVHQLTAKRGHRFEVEYDIKYWDVLISGFARAFLKAGEAQLHG